MVIGADSTLACNGRLFDKPPTMEAARKQLQALAGQTHELHSSVVVARGGVRLWHCNEHALLTMRPLPDAFLDAGALPTLHDRYGISAEKVAASLKAWLA
jgi:septum formation protein